MGERVVSHGRCWDFAKRLFGAWTELGFRPTITVGLLLPGWGPVIIWANGKASRRDVGYFSRPISAFRDFIAERKNPPPVSKKEIVFGQMLLELDARHEIRALSRAETGLRFRLLTAEVAAAPMCFQLSGL